MKLVLQLPRLRVYALENIGLLAFELLIRESVFLVKIDRELKVLTVHAAIGPDLARADAEHALPYWNIVESKGRCAAARTIQNGSANQSLTAAC